MSGLGASPGWAVWVYQLPRGLGSFNGLTGLCISVGCVVLGVLWRFCRPVVMVFIVVMGWHIYFGIKELLIMYNHIIT